MERLRGAGELARLAALPFWYKGEVDQLEASIDEAKKLLERAATAGRRQAALPDGKKEELTLSEMRALAIALFAIAVRARGPLIRYSP